MDGLTPGMTFELEVHRNFEGVPIDAGGMFEMKEAPLMSASNTMELIRNLPILDALRTAKERFSTHLVLAGSFWDLPVFKTAKDIANWGLDKLRDNPDAKK